MTTQSTPSPDGQKISDRPLAKRRQLAVKLGERLEGELSDSERDVAWGIARQLVEDTSQAVREELAVSLCNRPDLPKELGYKLARDADQVATPFLAKTPIFTDAELCEIVRAVSNKVRKAIAARPKLENALADLLAQVGDSSVADILITNKGAQIGISGYRAVIDRFGNEPSLLEKMAMRSELPASLVSELVGYVSDATRIFLEETYDVPRDIAARITEETESAVLLRLVDMQKNDEAEALLRVMHGKGLLNRTLCLLIARRGNLPAFAVAVSILTEIPAKNIELVLRQGAANAIAQVCQRAKLPEFAKKEIVERILSARTASSNSGKPSDSSASGEVA